MNKQKDWVHEKFLKSQNNDVNWLQISVTRCQWTVLGILLQFVFLTTTSQPLSAPSCSCHFSYDHFTSPKCRPPGGLLSNVVKFWTYMSAFKNKPTLCFIQALLIFSFNFRFLSAFISRVSERELQTSDSSIRNCWIDINRHKSGCCTTAFAYSRTRPLKLKYCNFSTYSKCERIKYQSTPELRRFRMCSLSVTNEQIHWLTHSQTNRH